MLSIYNLVMGGIKLTDANNNFWEFVIKLITFDNTSLRIRHVNIAYLYEVSFIGCVVNAFRDE